MPSRKFIIPIIDDEEEDRIENIRLITSFLEIIDFDIKNVDFKEFENAETSIEYFKNGGIADLITLDIYMTHGVIGTPELNGDAFLRNLKKLKIVLPVVVITTDPSEEISIKMKKLGCCHFIKKMELQEEDLFGNIEVLFTILKIAVKKYQYEQKTLLMAEESKKDHLTKLWRREYFLEKTKEIQQSKAESCMIIMDIDFFKKVNDIYGHGAGDNALRKISSIILKSIKDIDTAGRWGGEEFVLILKNVSIQNAEKAANRIRENIEKSPISTDKDVIHVTISIGLTLIKDDDEGEDSINRADKALLQAKETGRNKVVVI